MLECHVDSKRKGTARPMPVMPLREFERLTPSDRSTVLRRPVVVVGLASKPTANPVPNPMAILKTQPDILTRDNGYTISPQRSSSFLFILIL